jgi:DNA repair protein RecO
MSYAIYTFSGIIIRHTNVGENSRLFWLATIDSGVVMVRAQGIREEKSKMRAITQLFSFVKFEVIRGKDGWKLVGCSLLDGFPPLLEGGAERSEAEDGKKEKELFPYLFSLSEMIYNLVFESDTKDVPDLLDFYSRFISLLENGEYDSKKVLTLAYAELLSELGFLDQKYYLDENFFRQEEHQGGEYWKQLLLVVQNAYTEAGR